MARNVGTLEVTVTLDGPAEQRRRRVARRGRSDDEWLADLEMEVDALCDDSHPQRDFPRWPGYVALAVLSLEIWRMLT